MLTSFFGKSRPLNFLIVSIFILGVTFLHFILSATPTFTTETILEFMGSVVLLIFSMLVMDFIIRKNTITQLNTYAIFIFSCALLMLTQLTEAPKLILANLFLLLAFRRILSLRSTKKWEQKILDASIWIVLASIFYFWSVLWFIGLYIAITTKSQRQLRHYLIPIVGGVAIFLIATAYHFILDDSFAWFIGWLEDISFNYMAYSRLDLLIFITFISALIVWTVSARIVSLKSTPKKDRPTQLLTMYILGINILMTLLSPTKNGAEFIFMLAPTAIIISSFVEKKTEIWFRELLLWAFVLLPLLFVFIK